jgi:geranylgeranyl diphosphate synthase type II
MQNLSQLQEEYLRFKSLQHFPGYLPGLYQPAEYILSLGGKMFRPQLVLLGYALFRDDYAKAMPAAHAVELFHNFTLMHDDIMDQAPLRRGQPTVHTKFGVNSAILSGDMMLIYAYEYLLRLRKMPQFDQVMEVFNKAAIGVCEGQQLDMEFETSNQVDEKAYLNMIELKTAVLLGAALQIGALTAGADWNLSAALNTYMVRMGIAFQIQDDLLDVYGQPERFGKKPGGDIVRNKKTLLYIEAHEVAGTMQGKLEKLYATSPADEQSKIDEVTDIFNLLGVKHKVLQVQQYYISQAENALKGTLPEEKFMALHGWSGRLIARDI